MRTTVLTKEYMLYWEKTNKTTSSNIVKLLNEKTQYGELRSEVFIRVNPITLINENLVVKLDRFKLTRQGTVEADIHWLGSLRSDPPKETQIVFHARGFLIHDKLSVIGFDISFK